MIFSSCILEIISSQSIERIGLKVGYVGNLFAKYKLLFVPRKSLGATGDGYVCRVGKILIVAAVIFNSELIHCIGQQNVYAVIGLRSLAIVISRVEVAVEVVIGKICKRTFVDR